MWRQLSFAAMTCAEPVVEIAADDKLSLEWMHDP